MDQPKQAATQVDGYNQHNLFSNISSFALDRQQHARVPTGSSIGDPSSVLGDSGRFYHGYKEGKYLLPNDGAEQDRLDLQHAALLLLLDGQYNLAPIKDPGYVLDIATGTGIWAIEFARGHPQSQVYGTDLSAIQPQDVVPNCIFLREDAEEDEWYHGHSNPYDYIHLRLSFSCFDDPKKVMRNCFKCMKPGAWIEYQDTIPWVEFLDGNGEDTQYRKLCRIFEHGIAGMGRDPKVAQHYKDMLLEAGFVDVVEHRMIWPIGPWPTDTRLRKCGLYTVEEMHDGVRGVAWRLLEKGGMAPAEIEKMVSDVQSEYLSPQYRMYTEFYVVYGRKPYENGGACPEHQP